MVDRHSYAGQPKPQGAELGRIQNRLSRPEAHVSLGIEQLEWAIVHGLTIRPGLCIGGARLSDWHGQQLWFLDFDNDKSMRRRGYGVLDPLEAMSRAFDERHSFMDSLDPLFLYFTKSATAEPWNPRFRLVFGLGHVVADRTQAEAVGNALLRRFPEADQSSCQLNRMFLAGVEEVYPCWKHQM